MAEHTINENRKSKRFPTHLKAHYFFKERSEKGKECVVINISLNGAGLEFYTAKQLMSLLNFFYRSPPQGNGTISVEGIVRWVKAGGKGLCLWY